MTSTRVGFIGLGSQGGPMAREIAGTFPTTLWARREASVEPFSDTSAKVVGSPGELAAASDVICLCVVGDDDVLSLARGNSGLLAGANRGSVIVVHSTVHPDTCRILAEEAAPLGVSVVDAPVSGGGMGAAEHRLLVMVGGDDADVDRVCPVFETYANPIVHLGPLGAGQVTKILNNLLFSANLGAAASLLELGETLGIPRDRLCEVVTRGSANSMALGSVAGFGGSLDRLASVAGALLQKDVRLAADLAEKASAPEGAVFDAADSALSTMGFPR